ncbi:CAP domain-containing protein [Acuticoccus sp.]|uniref:CAP domain-containing protein n=1 Tax=Acuticoccus sp. TaxID=1904378 RepID=UPI003B527506
MAELTAREQYAVELINRARADPAAEAARYGIALDAGLPSGTIDATPKEPLAVVGALSLAAARHAADMLARDYFGHTGRDGSTPKERIDEAGWRPERSSSVRWGENLSGAFQFAASDAQTLMDDHHERLFRSEGHRLNMLECGFSEVGVGEAVGPFRWDGTTYPYSSLLTQDFADGGRTYITGVVIDDRDGDGSYDIGEGVSRVRVTVTADGFEATSRTARAGGYAIEVALGEDYEVTFSGRKLDGVVVAVAAVTDGNVKIDAIAGEAILPPEPDVLRGGKGRDELIGTRSDDRILGLGGNDRLFGRAGEDRLDGGSGRDRIVAGSGDDVLFGGNGPDKLFGDAGADTLDGGRGGDVLDGGAGDDLMIGGAGRDRYVYTSGVDTIAFATKDKVDLSALGLSDFASDVAPLLSRSGRATVLDLGRTDGIVFLDTGVADLSAEDFIF